MYINRALLLVVGVVLIFFPAIEGWMVSSEAAWYRPYLAVADGYRRRLLEPAHPVS